MFDDIDEASDIDTNVLNALPKIWFEITGSVPVDFKERYYNTNLDGCEFLKEVMARKRYASWGDEWDHLNKSGAYYRIFLIEKIIGTSW
jgi:hypothetical protein